MARWLAVILIVIVALAGIGLGSPLFVVETQAQQFPAAAVIRGENIRLRAEPAEATNDIAILQRGDEITITGDVTAADGLFFYPVEVVQSSDTGWVRDLFIDPKSIVALDVPAPEPVTEPAPDGSAAEGNNGRRERPARENRRNNRQAENGAAESAPAAEEASPAATPAPEVEQPVAGAAPQTEAIVFSGTGAATSEPVALQPGRYRATATMEVSAAGGFLCNLNGPDNFTETLFDEQIDSPQSWTARVSVSIETAGDYVIECSNTNDPWTIEFALRQ